MLHPEIDLSEWTAVEWLPKDATMGHRWRLVDGAPVETAERRRLVAAGELLQATRVTDDGTFVVVKTPTRALRDARKVA